MKNLFSYLLVAFLAVFIGSGVFLVMNNNKSKAPIAPSSPIIPQEANLVVETPTESLPSLLLSTLSENVTNQKEFSMDLMADSKEKNIVGYDISLSYDPLSFEFVRADSLQADYKIYTYKKDNMLTFTASKNLQSQASPFTSTKIVRLFFKPIKVGQYNFTLKSLTGSEKTDFITDKTEILNPSLNDLVIKVE